MPSVLKEGGIMHTELEPVATLDELKGRIIDFRQHVTNFKKEFLPVVSKDESDAVEKDLWLSEKQISEKKARFLEKKLFAIDKAAEKLSELNMKNAYLEQDVLSRDETETKEVLSAVFDEIEALSERLDEIRSGVESELDNILNSEEIGYQ